MPQAPRHRLTPQLAMQLDDLSSLPAIELPEGYSLCTFQPGDGQAWCDVIAGAFGGERRLGQFQTGMCGDPAFRADRIFFVIHGSEPVATASGWYRPSADPQGGYLHMVGCKPGHAGKRLGRAVSIAALGKIAQDGRRRAVLHTDDHRLPAIHTYLQLGFRPLLVHENQRERWREVFHALGQPERVDQFRSILDGPVHEPPQYAKDQYDLPAHFQPRRVWHPNRMHMRGDIDALGDESLYRASSLGTARIEPSVLAAGEDLPFTLTFRVGQAGLPAGAVVRFSMRGQVPLGTRTQANDPERRGYVEIAPADHATLEFVGPLGFRLADGALRAGDVVELRVGHGRGFTWTRLAGKREFKVTVQLHPAEPQMRLPEPVVVHILPLEPQSLDVLVDATPCGGAATATVTVRDEHDNRVELDGIVTLAAGEKELAAIFVNGIARIDLLPPDEVTRLRAKLPQVEGSFSSNPCVPGQRLQLFIGDLHAHDFFNEAEGYSDEVYRWAMEDKALDFLSVPLQSHGGHDNERWTIYKYMNERYLDEGRFVTFLAFEWQHSHYGDKVVHYLAGDQPYLPVDDSRYDCPAKLYEALRGSDALVISHHPGYALDQHVPGTDWSAVETDVDRLAEVWSMHGSSEGYDPEDRPVRDVCWDNTVLAALRRGMRVGIVAGSDTHSGRPGGAVKEPRMNYPGGLCAVWAESLTRRAIFAALEARRTYALTASRIVLDVRVNEQAMGSEIPYADHVGVQVDAWACGPIATVEVLKDGQPWQTASPDGDECHLSFEDRPAAPAFYHCRLTQTDGHRAVCSPVWVG